MSLRSNVQVVVGFEIARVFINARRFFGCTSCGTFCVVPFFSLHICTDFKEKKEEGGEKGAVEAVVIRIRE